MNGKSLAPDTEKINQLKQLFPEVFSEEKIDWEKLRATLGENVNFANERYVLNWAGKSDAFRVMQQPSMQTLVPVESESVNFHETENIFIEGENMEVLKVLQKSYFGRVKMIYIDPPYNTGNDSFIYPDRFSETKTDYQKRVGDKDEEGYMTHDGMFQKNSRENGQYHSNWLNMMMPRLYLAKNLLREDGVIFVSIDDNEVHNLRLLMNEIFGEENFVACVNWHKNYASANDSKTFSSVIDYILVFSKSNEFTRNLLPRTAKQNVLYKYDSNDGKGKWRSDNLSVRTYSANYDYPITNPNTGVSYNPPSGRSWMTNKETIQKWIDEGRIFFGQNGQGAPQLKRYLNEVQDGVVPITYWNYDDCGHNDEARKEIKELFEKPPFDSPKPTRLIKQILNIGSDKDSIILDFFAGSATTAHAVMQLNKEDASVGSAQAGNRKFILVQLPELCEEKSEAYKVGYHTIADIAKERIRRAGKKIRDEITEENKKKKGELDFAVETDGRPSHEKLDTGFKVFKLAESNFKQWRQPAEHTAEELAKQLQLFIDPVAENANLENMVYELLLKSGKDLNAQIENHDGYSLIDGNELALLLHHVNEELIGKVISHKPKKVIALDRIFNGNDQLKTNTTLQMKDAGVEFKTI
ncbi:MAG: site-specific DNA-methyltransferase [Tissierellia bacterium]|nr:site-specific DNA-methyltransferase [Tissierellia bacterium]